MRSHLACVGDRRRKIREVPVHDLHATVLHQLGIDHERLAFKHQGRRYRLTDVHGHGVKDLLA